MASNSNQNNVSEKPPADNNSETSNRDPLVNQIGSCFEKFADALGVHMTSLGTQISTNIIEAINNSENLRIGKEEVARKRPHSSRAKANEEDEVPTERRKRQKIGSSSSRDKSHIQEQRKVRQAKEVRNDDMSSEDDESEYYDNDDIVSIPSEDDMNKKMKELHGSLHQSDDEEEPLFKDYTKVLTDTGNKGRPLNKKLSELINTLWQQKEPLDKLKGEIGIYDPPQNCKCLVVKHCNEEIWNGYLQNKHRNVDLKTQKVQKTVNKGGIILGQVADSLIKIKHDKEMTLEDMKKEVLPLIQMCTDDLTFLAHGNNLLNQTRRNYITSVLPPHMAELGKKVPEDSDLLFGDNLVARINQNKAKQQALRYDGFKNPKNLNGFSRNPENRQNGYPNKRRSQNNGNRQTKWTHYQRKRN